MPPRNRKLTEDKIRDAAIRILKEAGFENWGVNAIAREAGVDKVLIYRYFDSLDGLLDSVVAVTDFWPDPESLPGSAPMSFIDTSIDRMREEIHAWVLFVHPRFDHAGSSVRRRFSSRRQIWMDGLMSHVSGNASGSFAESVSAHVLFQVLTGMDGASWSEIWHDTDWNTASQIEPEDDLPVELL